MHITKNKFLKKICICIYVLSDLLTTNQIKLRNIIPTQTSQDMSNSSYNEVNLSNLFKTHNYSMCQTALLTIVCSKDYVTMALP